MRVVAPLIALVMVAVQLVGVTPAMAVDTCIHTDVKVFADGELISEGSMIASDGGFGHAGTGVTFTFQARTFRASADYCVLRTTDALTWQIPAWPCENHPRPKPVATQSLTWSLTVPLDCEVAAPPGLLGGSLTNGKGAASGNALIYAGAPEWVLPHEQARGLFGPFAMQADPVNTLTGALTEVVTDAAAPGLGVALSVDRTYNSNAPDSGVHGKGWRASYSDHLTIERAGASLIYHAADGRNIRFTRAGAGPSYVIERGPARFDLVRTAIGFTLTTYERMAMTFSAAGALTGIRDRNGQGVTVDQRDGKVVAVSNGRRALRYQYDAAGLITSVVLSAPGMDPRIVRYSYQDGRLTEVTSPGGLKTRYGYDEAGRLTSRMTGDRSTPEITTKYDASGRVESQTDGNGHTMRWSWVQSGVALSGTSTMTDPTGARWLNEYKRGWLVGQTDPTGIAVRFSYDAAGNLTHVLDGQGNGARQAYDVRGRVTKSVAAAGGVVRRGYNATNDQTSEVDQSGRPIAASYDGRGNPTSITQAGKTVTTTYDARGLATVVRDPLGRTTRFAFNTDGDLIRTTDPAGLETSYEIDGWGRITSVKSPRGAVTRISYDAESRVERIVGPGGATVQRQYDGRGRLVGTTDAAGRTTTLKYDEADQVVAVQGPDANLPEATIAYDPSGRVVKQVDPGGRAHQTSYDGAGRPLTVTYGGRTWKFGYDKSGRLIRTTLPSGKAASFALDRRGLISKVTYSDGTPAVSFTWDQLGRRTSQTDGTGKTTYAYDSFDRLQSAQGPGGAIEYQWDAVGNLLSRKAAGHTESYTWDLLDRLSQVKVDGRPLATYRYDVPRGTATTQHADGMTELQRFDERDRLVSTVVTRGASALRKLEYAYDAVNQVVRTSDSKAGTAAYEYDPSGRLTQVCYAVDKCAPDTKDFIRYAYDGSGNRTWEQRPSGATWFGFGGGSEPVGSIGLPSRFPIEWPQSRANQLDADGNLRSDGTTTYTWSAAGKPVSSIRDGVTTTYQHAGDGRRIAQTTKGTATRFLWDPLSPQILASGPTRYIYGEGVLASLAGGRATPMVTGPTGSTLMTGTTHHDFEPYGAPRGPAAAGLGYAGGLRLPGGTYLFGQREYDPTTALFLSPDQGASDQPYGYGLGNPLSFSDLSGMWSRDEILTKVSKIGGGVSTGALLVAVGCTVAVVCAPLVPFALATAAVTGTIAGVSDGILSAEACAKKGNCSRLIADFALIAITSRLPVLRTAKGFGRTAGKACSFAASTAVLMADGSTKPISQIRAGDQVHAEDPETGSSGARIVTATWTHSDDLFDLEINRDVLTTTDDHPFWSEADRRYSRADRLRAGDRLRTTDGRSAVVGRFKADLPRSALAYNLSVDDLSTYFVLAGATPVLVHNTNSGCDPNWSWRSGPTFGHTFKTHGAGDKNARKLTDRARSTGNQQGQWLDNEAAADFLKSVHVPGAGPRSVRIPDGLGRVIMPDGTVVPARAATLIHGQGDLYKTAFPIVGP
ncbi:polymorphic toxin-type HINT domain-containing protein [Kribbella deserti]|uniref:Polymorphic toxin-type HINT domain-containing protein n=1 Tax=Kribbella deserti TaxID=1926257 RepID=A0ABV6QXJ6_9ACTN